MSPLPVSTNFIEEQYKKIRERRKFLESEFARLEKEYKELATEVSQLADDSGTQNVRQRISQI